jgi:hypothetical protein
MKPYQVASDHYSFVSHANVIPGNTQLLFLVSSAVLMLFCVVEANFCYSGSYLFIPSKMGSYVNMDAGVFINTHLAEMLP